MRLFVINTCIRQSVFPLELFQCLFRFWSESPIHIQFQAENCIEAFLKLSHILSAESIPQYRVSQFVGWRGPSFGKIFERLIAVDQIQIDSLIDSRNMTFTGILP